MINIIDSLGTNYVLCKKKSDDMNLDNSITTLMTSELRTANPDDKLIVLKHIYEKQDFHSHIPVTEGAKLVGIVSLIDFMHAIEDATLDDEHEAYHAQQVRDIMTPNPISISPESTIRQAAEILAEKSFHSVLIAEKGDLKGIVTTHDILKELVK